MANIPLLPSLLMTVTFYAADCCLGAKKKKRKRITSQILLVKLAKPDYQQNKWPTANS